MSRSLIPILTLAALSTACIAAAPEEPTRSIAQAITNGDDDSSDAAVVALLIEGKVFCTGVLIAPSVVATAAHCVTPRPPEQVYFGSKPSKTKGTFVDVTDSRAHSEFDEDTLANDIAVVGLATDAPVPPLPLVRSALGDALVGQPIRLVGFGAPNADGENDLEKRSGETTVFSVGSSDFRFHPGPSQTCNGDSGGPALATIGGEEWVIGITSSGDTDCTRYGRDIRVDRYRSFLTSYAKAYAARIAPDDNQGCSTSRSKSPATASLVAAAIVALARRRRQERA